MPKNDWILDVLADLRSFAEGNGLESLADQLADTMLVAAAELTSRSEEAFAEANGTQGSGRPDSGGARRLEHA